MAGERIGNYLLQRELGRGNMGTVYLAVHISQGYQVALKVMSYELSQDLKAVQRFEREAQAVSALRHPNIVHLYEAGWDAGYNYIAMQYIEGSSLAELMRPRRPLDIRSAISLLDQVSSALDCAHDSHIIHRDVKPSNILVDRGGKAFLTDFGIAKNPYQSSLTTMGGTLGTPAYISPEQAQGAQVDHRSDIYSLGVIAYELLTGRPPFQKEEVVALLLAHVQETPLPLRSINPALPPAVDAAVLRALAKDPARRYGSAGEFARALASAAGQPVSGRMLPRTSSRGTSPALASYMVAGLLVIAAIAILVAWLAGQDRGTGSTTSVTSSGQLALAFESDRDGNKEIYAATALGTSARRLTNHVATDWAPAWSFDGQRIAFVSERDGDMEIYVMGRNGGNLLRLTNHSAWDSGPTWSPDGGHLAFDSNRDGDWDIYRMASDGSGVQALTRNNAMDGDPDWSPLGDQIAFQSDRDGNLEIYVMSANDGGSQTRLTNNTWQDSSPAWSPDGRQLVFESQRESGTEICVMDRDGSGTTRLTFNSVEDRQPSWTADGAHIVFARQRGSGGVWEIWSMAADGGDPELLVGGAGSNANPACRR